MKYIICKATVEMFGYIYKGKEDGRKGSVEGLIISTKRKAIVICIGRPENAKNRFPKPVIAK